MNLAKHTIAGRLVRDHDLRYTPQAKAVLTNCLAVNYKSREGQESVTYYNLEAWERNAENLSNYTSKGSPVFLECRMKNEKWEKDGKTFYKEVFVIISFQLLESQAEAAARGEARASQPAQGAGERQRPPAAAPVQDYDEDEEPPF